jgi:mRNA-degrading endonuclease YafQ of YafQ-DinJ toxin-antitoxin module
MRKRKPQPRPKHYTIMDEMMASPTEPMPLEYRTHQLTRMYQGLHSMETAPAPTTDDWRVVSDAVNLMETLVVEMKVCEDSSGLLMDAITGLALAGKRNMAGGSIRMDGSGIQAVRAILSDYAELLDMLSARTMIRCHRLTEKRLHDMLDGRREPHDVEITSL